MEKDHGRIERRRCFVFDQLDCLHKPQQWPDLKCFAVIESERTIIRNQEEEDDRYDQMKLTMG